MAIQFVPWRSILESEKSDIVREFIGNSLLGIETRRIADGSYAACVVSRAGGNIGKISDYVGGDTRQSARDNLIDVYFVHL